MGSVHEAAGAAAVLAGSGDALPAEERTAALEARAVLARAARIREYLTQHLQVTEAVTGMPGEAVSPGAAITGLGRLLTGLS